MDNTLYLQNKFFDALADKFKQRYLRRKIDFPSYIIPFQGTTAWLIAFAPRGFDHKGEFIQILASAFAAKGITRFGFFVDTLCAQVLTGKELVGLSEDEREKLAEKRRAEIPRDFRDYEQSTEAILWGICSEKGVEKVFRQEHDSKEFKLLSRAVSSDEVQIKKLNLAKIIPLSKEADFKRVNIRKSEMWDMMLHYMKALYAEVEEVSIPN